MNFTSWRWVSVRLIAVIGAVAVLAASLAPVAASTPPQTKKHSYTVLNSGTSRLASIASPCNGKGCANGIRITWSAGECYQQDRYTPLELVWSSKNMVATKAWPLNAACSTGVKLTWDKYNQINEANWLGTSSQLAKAGLAICFQFKTQCSAGHCVTAGCIPQHTTGFDLFFQDGDRPLSAEWLVNGKASGSIDLSGSPSNVFWYGYTPPASSFASAASSSSPATPAIKLTGRNANGNPQIITSAAPSGVDGVDMTWFLPKYDTIRGCHPSGGTFWTSPPLGFAYTTNGQISSPIMIPHCPVSANAPLTMNDIEFSWKSTSTGIELTKAEPWYYIDAATGCQNSYPSSGIRPGAALSPANYPTGTIAQPPAGANGILFVFGHDDYKASCWRKNGNIQAPPLSHPGHPRFAVLTP